MMIFPTIRAWHYNEERGVIEMSPFGGICVAINLMSELEDGTYVCNVSYSICESNMTFNKNRARDKAKAHPPRTLQVASLGGEDVLQEYIDFHYPLINIVQEIEDLQRAYSKLKLSKNIALKHREHHKETIEALKLKERYNELQDR